MIQKKPILVSFFILLFLLSFHFFGWLRPVESVLRLAIGKTSFGLYNLGNDVKNYFGRWASYKNLFEENQKCLEKVAALSVAQSQINQIKEENEILRAQLNFVKEIDEIVIANIIGKSSDPSSNLLIIDRGKKDGVKEGDGVVTGKGILIGKIVKTEDSLSYIRPLTDNQSKIAVSVLNQNRTAGVISGEYNLRIKLTLVPLTENIKPGDQIVTSNLDQNIPRGLLIGQIESVQKELYQPFQSATVKPVMDLSRLSVVTVLLK